MNLMRRLTAEHKVLWKPVLIPIIFIVFWVGHDGYFPATPLVHAQGTSLIPAASDWTDYGLVIDATPFGQGWDVLFEGGTPAALVKKDGTYYLYYVGADDYISQKDNIGPSHQFIGVATSSDGVNWTKYAGNPVITFSSSGNPEEGAVTAGVYVDSGGIFHVYYGANIAQTPTTNLVNANVRYATSPNGFDFTDQGLILRYNDSSVWGWGDELHSTLAWKQGNTWYSYYVPNGVAVGGKLGVAWGTDPRVLSNTLAVTSAGNTIPGGPGSIVQMDSDTLAFFVTRGGVTEVRTASITNPTVLSAPLQTYNFNGFGKVVYLDPSKRTWFMIYDQWSYMGLQLAPYGSPDLTPPTAPSNLSITFPDHQTAVLSWQAATDLDTGIVQYDIFRDGQQIGSTKTLTFEDTHLSELTAYAYAVRAVNFHGTAGAGAALTATTPADTAPPELSNILAAQNPYQLQVTFAEPVDRFSAENPAHYTLTNGLFVSSAVLSADETSVILTTTSPQLDNAFYTLTVTDIADQAQSPNYASRSQGYTYSTIPALSSYYPLETTAADTSGANNHGVLHGNLAWPAGIIGRSLTLTGSQYVEIDNTPSLDHTFSGSYTLTGWARPASIPPNTTNSNAAYAIFSGPNVRLEYDASQQFVAQIPTSSGTTTLRSPLAAVGPWYHLAMVLDSLQKRLYLYVNGTAVPGSPVSYTGALSPLPAPVIGVMDEYYSRYRIGVNDPLFDLEKNFFVGNLDEIRIYSQALSSVQVAAIYQRDIATPTPTPSSTPVNTPTHAPTSTPLGTQPKATSTPQTATRTSTPTATPSSTLVNTPTHAPPTATLATQPKSTSTPPTATPSSTPTVMPGSTPVNTPTHVPPTATPTNAPTHTPTSQATPSPSPSAPSATPTPTLVVKPSVLINGSFEIDSNQDNLPDDWSKSRTNGRDIRIESSLADGSYIFRFTPISGNNVKGLSQGHLISGTTGDVWQITLWTKTDLAMPTGRLRVQLMLQTAAGAEVAITQDLPPNVTGAYQTVSITAPIDYASITLRLESLLADSNGYLDNISLTRL
jgi:hypothetical protein